MLKNYFLVAYRNLRKSKVFTAINVVGLAVGMSVCLLILTLVRDQATRDEHHPHAKRIYRVTSENFDDTKDHFATSPATLGPALERTAPAVDTTVQLKQESLSLLRQHESFSADGFYATPPFLTVFAFPLALGNPTEALVHPFSVVLSHQTAQKLFGENNPLGKTVQVERKGDPGKSMSTFTVTGVLKETDTRSHLASDVYLSFATLSSGKVDASHLNDWRGGALGYYNYLLLEVGHTPHDVQSQLTKLAETHYSKEDYFAFSFALQPLTGIHLGPLMGNEIRQSGILAKGAVYTLGGLALLILLAAGFNYANLSVARSLKRAKEIGVRKTVGAGRGQVAVQFLGESVLVALAALVVALALLPALVPAFNSLHTFDVQIGFNPLQQPLLLLLFVGFAIGAGLLAGTYPAFYLSRFDPVGVLASSGSNSRSRSSRFGLRKGLMVLQFGMALFFIITAVLFYRQASFMAHTDYGFKTERLSYVKLQDTPPEAFKNRTMQLLGVESVSMTSKVPVVPGLGRDGGTTNLRVVGGQPNDVRKNPEDGVKAYFYWVGADYVENMGLELIAGQERVKTAFTDGSSVIINERAVQELGFGSPSQAIGQTITYGEGDMRVVGVVEDYTYMSLRRQRYPLILRHDPEQFRYALVRAHPGHVKGVVSGLRDVWAQFDSVHPLDYGLYDDALERMAAPMVEGARLIGLAALLTVLIACLGLLGMAAYAVRTRTQEIGIRKALGASAEDVVWLLSKGYLWLVAGAAALALPLAYLVNRQWLADYAHRIDIGWVTPALCTATLLALALAVVGTQTVRAALANPADSLRHE